MENKPLDWTSLSGFPSRTTPWSTWRWKECFARSSTKSGKILPSTLNPCLQWPDMDVTRMDQSETIQMFKSKLRFQIRFQGLEESRTSYFFSDTETSDKGSVKKKKTSRVSSTGTTGLRDLVSKSFVIFKSSALMESSWTTLARISEALTAALSGGFSSSFLLIHYFPVQFDKYFLQIPHCLQKSFESDRKYWHSCCLWYQVYCKRKKNCFGILQGLSI